MKVEWEGCLWVNGYVGVGLTEEFRSAPVKTGKE